MPRDFSNLSERQRRRRIMSLETSQSEIPSKISKTQYSLITNQVTSSSSISQLQESSTKLQLNELNSNIFSECVEEETDSLRNSTEGSLTYLPESNSHDENVSSDNESEESTISAQGNGVIKKSLHEDLRECFQNNNVSQRLINYLLEILRSHGHHELPQDARTLMQTPRQIQNIYEIEGGQYLHFGLFETIRHYVSQRNHQNTNISFNINIDGLPVSKSSGSQFWPILGDIVSKGTYTDPFVIGIFHGLTKPKNLTEFLKYFVDEYQNLHINGLTVNNRTYFINLNCIICDAPAKSFVTNVKNHTGYFGCSKCLCEGEYIEKRVVFLSTDSGLRTNDSFRNRSQPEHHRGPTILESIDFDIVKQIPLDYMHLVLLGVTKRIITLWLKGDKTMRLNKIQIEHFEKLYLDSSKYITSDFSRKPRSIGDVERWKATEFRLFLLYVGPVIMKNILSNKAYNHFLSLAVAIRLLSENGQNITNINYAHTLLVYFVKKFKYFFSIEYVTYNVHNLIHLAEDVKVHGCLDNFSAFKFENFMYKLKQLLKTSRLPLQQVHNRLQERNIRNKTTQNNNFPEAILKNNEVYGVNLQHFSISLKHNENYCLLTDGRVVVIEKITRHIDTFYFYAKYFQKYEPLFNTPCNSTLLGIRMVSIEDLSDCKEPFGIDIISKKLLRLPVGNRETSGEIYMEKKRFAVVFLPAENIYSEMPTSWLTKDREHCWWPKTLNARLFMKRGDAPDPKSWDLHEVQIEAYCSTLESARRKAEDPEFSSTSNEIEKTGRGRRKKNNMNFSPSSESSLSDETLTPPPSPATPLSTKFSINESGVTTCVNKNNKKKEHKSDSNLIEHGNVIHEMPSVVYDSDITTHPTSESDGIRTSKKFINIHTNSQTPSVVNEELLTSGIESGNNNIEIIIDENMSFSAISSGSSRLPGGNIIAVEPSETRCITMEDLSSQIAQLKTVCLANQKYIQDVNKRLKSMLQQEGEHVTDMHMNLIHGKIPFNDIDDLKTFDAGLTEQEEMKKALITHMKVIGGRDSRDNIYRCLSRIFTNQLATQCSWHGQRGNFKLSDLNLMKILSDVVLCKNKNDVTLNEFEKHVGEWFRLGKQRLNREKK